MWLNASLSLSFLVFHSSLIFSCPRLRCDGRPVPCCLTVSGTNIRADYIVRYTMQDQPLCPIRAVRFHTKKNKVICSDRDNNWAKNAMRIVDGRKETKPSQKPTMCNSSTTNIIPTVNTTNKTPGTETETSTSITVTPKVTTVKTSGPEATYILHHTCSRLTQTKPAKVE
uniref:Chemokine interleukin-8-like domain-containing protein n=1 Tax=Sinocyclocheilus rhinocerous TaxID=307959 RepID=A0A673KRM4_9TELE